MVVYSLKHSQPRIETEPNYRSVTHDGYVMGVPCLCYTGVASTWHISQHPGVSSLPQNHGNIQEYKAQYQQP